VPHQQQSDADHDASQRQRCRFLSSRMSNCSCSCVVCMSQASLSSCWRRFEMAAAKRVSSRCRARDMVRSSVGWGVCFIYSTTTILTPVLGRRPHAAHPPRPRLPPTPTRDPNTEHRPDRTPRPIHSCTLLASQPPMSNPPQWVANTSRGTPFAARTWPTAHRRPRW